MPQYLRHERELLKQVARRQPQSIANYLHGLKQTQQLFNRIARQQAEWQSLVNRLVEPSRSMLLAIARLADDERRLNELARCFVARHSDQVTVRIIIS
jgi:hypothetical protein